MSKSFFSTLQGWVGEQAAADYGGRYLGLLIKQVSDFDPSPFRKFFVTKNPALRRGKFRLDTEVSLRINGRVRRADVVIYIDDVPKLLIELKYRDRLTAAVGAVPEQLSDYLDLCRKLPSRPKFLLMHREPLRDDEARRIKSSKHLTAHYQELVPFLRESKNPASVMLLQYLQEEGLVIEPIDTDQLYRFMHRLTLPAWGSGSGRIIKTSEIDEGPQQFQRLLSNMRLVAADITPVLRTSIGKGVTRAATVDFSVNNSYETARMKKLLLKETGRSVEIDARARDGGYVDVWAQHSLPSGLGSFYLHYGYQFHLGRKRSFRAEGYVYLWSREIAKATGNMLWDERFSLVGDASLRDFRSWKKGDFESEFVDLIRKLAKSALRARVIADRSKIATLKRLANL